MAENKKKAVLGSLQPDVEPLLELNDLTAADFAPASSDEKEDFIQQRKSVSYWADAWRRLRHNIVAMVALGLYPMCYIARLTRSSMLDALGQDYIKTARAKGLMTPKIIFKHALRNAVIPVITYLGPLTAFTLVGGFVVETVYTIPGLGRYLVQSVQNRDYFIIMGTTIFLASLVVIMNLVVDILYRVVDPRIDLTKGE